MRTPSDKPVYVNIAGCIIKIVFVPFEQKEKYTRENIIQRLVSFLCKPNEKPDYEIQFHGGFSYPIFTSTSKISYIGYLKRKSSKVIVTYYHISYEQFLLIVRDICQEYLASHEGCLLHGSAIGFHKSALLFIGRSGSGKSTIVKLLKNEFTPLIDDMMIIRKEKQNFFLYQTPFVERNKYPIKKEKFQIGGYSVLIKSTQNLLKQTEKLPEESFENQLFTTPADVFQQLNLMKKLSQQLPAFRLYFSLSLRDEISKKIREILHEK